MDLRGSGRYRIEADDSRIDAMVYGAIAAPDVRNKLDLLVCNSLLLHYDLVSSFPVPGPEPPESKLQTKLHLRLDRWYGTHRTLRESRSGQGQGVLLAVIDTHDW